MAVTGKSRREYPISKEKKTLEESGRRKSFPDFFFTKKISGFCALVIKIITKRWMDNDEENCMKIRELLKSQSITLGAKAENKKDCIEKMTVLMETAGNLADRKQYMQGVLKREAEGTTGIGKGITIPHAKNAAVKKAGLAAMVLEQAVDFDSLDGEPVKLIFMIAAPDNGANEHLEALSKLSTMRWLICRTMYGIMVEKRIFPSFVT